MLNFSPRREAVFQKIKHEVSPECAGFQTLCPTRWTVRASSLTSVISNYEVIQFVWDEALDIARDSETRALLIGFHHRMSTFEYFFWYCSWRVDTKTHRQSKQNFAKATTLLI